MAGNFGVQLEYEDFLDEFMAEYGTTENYLRAYGGSVMTTEAHMSKNGKLTIPFSRPIVFPLDLLADFDSSYTEEAVP